MTFADRVQRRKELTTKLGEQGIADIMAEDVRKRRIMAAVLRISRHAHHACLFGRMRHTAFIELDGRAV